MKIRTIAVCALLFGGVFSTAEAACTCQCVDGQMQPLCSSVMDLPPICPPTICSPLPAPTIAPLMPPTLPPLGTSSCRQAQICDNYGNCRWQQVCQ